MRLLLAAILFLFFAIYAPTSHGDRPLLFSKQQQQDKIEYSQFKLPLARQQAAVPSIKTVSVNYKSTSFFSVFLIPFQAPALLSNYKPTDQTHLLFFSSAPLVFFEILQV